MRIAGGHEAILQEQPLVVVGAVADENLLVPPAARTRSNFIAASFLVKCCFYLERKIIKDLFKAKHKLVRLSYYS